MISSTYGEKNFTPNITSSGNTTTFSETILISEPIIKIRNGYSYIRLEDSYSYLLIAGRPVLPLITRTFIFPLGTVIQDINVNYEYEVYPLKYPIIPFSQYIINDFNSIKDIVKDETVYNSRDFYPKEPLFIQEGGGLKNGEHVSLFSIHVFPQYDPHNLQIIIPATIDIDITVQRPEKSFCPQDLFDLIIISPEEFSSTLLPLIDHKNNHNVRTTLQTVETIYEKYPGRDNQEKIKYFIKDAIEKLNVSYVMIVGSIDHVPMRISETNSNGYDFQFLTDLYYADIYDSNGSFCSWDGNNNNFFGEFTGQYNYDDMDFYPDIHIGRLPCTTKQEVQNIVDKIILYESETYGQPWFHDLICMGGDTFSSPFYEGERSNSEVIEIMSSFTPSIIWASEDNFNRDRISREINQGAGFLYYSGHGSENFISTFKSYGSYPTLKYYSRYIRDLTNSDRLPIMYFAACLTAKLDFSLIDWLFPEAGILISILFPHFYNNLRAPCFAWSMVNHEDGGAIASIGATEVSFAS